MRKRRESSWLVHSFAEMSKLPLEWHRGIFRPGFLLISPGGCRAGYVVWSDKSLIVVSGLFFSGRGKERVAAWIQRPDFATKSIKHSSLTFIHNTTFQQSLSLPSSSSMDCRLSSRVLKTNDIPAKNIGTRKNDHLRQRGSICKTMKGFTLAETVIPAT